MKKTTLILVFTILAFSTTSCKKEIETLLETDYKVIEVDYGFDNYMNNTRDKSQKTYYTKPRK